jgi:hypothetical protein
LLTKIEEGSTHRAQVAQVAHIVGGKGTPGITEEALDDRSIPVRFEDRRLSRTTGTLLAERSLYGREVPLDEVEPRIDPRLELDESSIDLLLHLTLQGVLVIDTQADLMMLGEKFRLAVLEPQIAELPDGYLALGLVTDLGNSGVERQAQPRPRRQHLVTEPSEIPPHSLCQAFDRVEGDWRCRGHTGRR